jgi:hypothetical protein
MGKIGCPERLSLTTKLRCVKSEKSEYLTLIIIIIIIIIKYVL